MRAQFAISAAVTTITRTITVAAGVFAPGHLGELTQVVPFELADAVLADTRCVQRRLRLLPSRVGMYFVLAMCLFPGRGYLGVWAQLTAALDGLGLAVPSARALRDVRRRLGAAPLRTLFEVLAGPVAWPRMPGVCFGRYRTVVFDGCKTIKVPDTAANRAWLGKMNAALGQTGYPVIQLMTLVETGTRALLGAAFGSTATGEITWAATLVDLLDATMLVLLDRGLYGGDFLRQVAAAKAQFLVRLACNRRLPLLGHLPDGSVLSLTGGVKVRIIEASVTVTCHDGTRYGGTYRLATTLLDHRAYPAAALIALYHERWEHEITYLALRHTLLAGRVLRSHDPEGLKQEMWALLALYQALRIAITDAVAAVPGTDPDRASYQIAVQSAQATVTQARSITTGSPRPATAIGRAVLAGLHPPRRPRVCARRVKSPLSRWNKHPPGKPRTCQKITKITTEVHTGRAQHTTTRRKQYVTTASDP